MAELEKSWLRIVSGESRSIFAIILRRLLWIAQWATRLGSWWRNRSFNRGKNVERVAIPVISVGNLTMGGTGKTPCVEYVAGLLREKEKMIAILSRGYGSNTGPNDEAMVLDENLPDVPHLQGAKRTETAKTAIEELESEVLVLDDGFQHRYLARDLDVVLIDVTNPWGYGYLFPRGLLRESRSNLKRAGAIVLTRCDNVSRESIQKVKSEVSKFASNVPVAETIHEPLELVNGVGREEVAVLRNRTVAAFCGIGNPAAFEKTLQHIGANVKELKSYPDHYNYQKSDIDALTEWAAKTPEGTCIVTTQKDWVKLQIDELAGRPLKYLRIGLKFIDGKEEFDAVVANAAGC